MKKIWLLISIVVITVSCSDEESIYSSEQEKVFSIFNGTWNETNYSGLGIQPDKIVFGTHYKNPVDVYKEDYKNGKIFLFSKQGECSYHRYSIVTKDYEITDCYYDVLLDATHINIYRQSDESSFGSYELVVISASEFTLRPSSLTFPYRFKKQ